MELSYRPRSIWIGIAAGTASLVVALGLLLASSRRRVSTDVGGDGVRGA